MNSIIWPTPGSVIYFWFLGIFRHKGIVSNRFWNGKPMVIANSWTSNGVAEISWDEFSGTHTVFYEGYPSTLLPVEVLYNARCLIGQHYDPLLSNCEHFVCKCHGLKPRSPQAIAIVIAATLAGVFAVASQT